jgi:hypothetical protein
MLDDARQRRRRRAALRKERDARYRQRRDACKACYIIEADGEVLDLLVKTRWISEEEVGDKKLVEAAISAMLSASART